MFIQINSGTKYHREWWLEVAQCSSIIIIIIIIVIKVDHRLPFVAIGQVTWVYIFNRHRHRNIIGCINVNKKKKKKSE